MVNTERLSNAKHNAVFVSANNAETAMNTAATVDTKLMVSLKSFLKLDRRNEDDAEMATGYEEATQVYRRGALASGTLEFEHAKPSDAAFVMGYGHGVVTTEAAGTGQKHVITNATGKGNPTFTAVQRKGKTIFFERFSGNVIEGYKLEINKDDWIKLTANVKGTGKRETDMVKETVEAAANATALAVSYAVKDDDSASVHKVLVELTTGVWTAVTVTGASGAFILVSAAGAGTGLVNYKCTYRQSLAWAATTPAVVEELAMAVENVTILAMPKWDGSAVSGGFELDPNDFRSLAIEFNNNIDISFAPGGTGTYANSQRRNGRSQSLTLTRDLADAVLEMLGDDAEQFAFYYIIEGAEFDTGHKFTVAGVYPVLEIPDKSDDVDGRWNTETVTFKVLEDPTYGSFCGWVKNEVATYVVRAA